MRANKSNYILALDYHENTKLASGPDDSEPNVQYKIYPNTKVISLQKNNFVPDSCSDDTFLCTMLMRKSTRTFSDKNISLDTLGTLLTLSCGLKNDYQHSTFRTYASAGARYPIEVYVAVFRSDDLECGIYHYNVLNNTLELIKKGDYSNQLGAFYKNQIEATGFNFPCLIMFSMVFKRTLQRYGERGYRYILLDAGHMSQNLYLTSTYLELGIVGLGAGKKSDEELDNILGLLSSEENVFYGFALGYPRHDDKEIDY